MSLRASHRRSNKNPPSDSGSNDAEELLVFGYQCKLFRDDEKALYIDEEKHLIPWMGDSDLMIDRYDGRGHLHDLGQYDADVNPCNSDMLSEEEKHIEAICDEERYMELHVDLAEKAIYEEEELKRLHQELAADESSASYQAVGFSYEQYDPAEPTQDATASEVNEDDTPEDEEEQGVFIPAPELLIPPHMECPASLKLNSVIEKTAEFVSKHGGQMEIMIKTKQSANPQFGFLMFEHPLNPYYKHMVSMIKCGRYIPGLHKPQMQAPERDISTSSDSDDDDDGYLHPSLRPSSSTQCLPKLPALTSSQIENTSYGMLIKRIGIIAGTASPVNVPQGSSSRQDSPAEPDRHQHDENASYDLPPPPGTEDVLLPDMPQKPPSPAASETESDAAVVAASPERNGITPVPPSDIKMIIDRMASYVAKDGTEFENQVRAQNDLRFEFLNESHPHHSYYEKVKAMIVSEDKERTPASKAVSFSIRNKDQDSALQLEKKATFLLNDSSDEESENRQSEPRQVSATGPTNASTAPFDQPKPTVPAGAAPATLIEETQKKLNEQRLKDKLAAAAREKLAQTTKESKHRLLQEERKKRAAMFVTMLKTTGKGEPQCATAGSDTALPYKESNSRQAKASSVTAHSHSRSPRRSRSRSSHRRRRSKSRSPSKKHSRSSSNRSSYSSGKRRSPEPETRHVRHKHSKKSKTSRRSRSRSRSPVVSASAIHRDRSPGVAKLRPPYDVRVGASNLTSQPKNASEDKRRDQSADALANGKPPFLKPANEDSIVKVKKMLQASRKAIFKEDMIGD